MTRAVVIKTSGEVVETQVSTPPDLQEIKAVVGGWLEAVLLPNGDYLFCNEEGKLQGLPLNELATFLYGQDVIVGDVIILGPPNGDGDNTDARLLLEEEQ